jgi:hypothetical protein
MWTDLGLPMVDGLRATLQEHRWVPQKFHVPNLVSAEVARAISRTCQDPV